MSREALLARGRAVAEAAMKDSCTITRVGRIVADRVTGRAVEVDVVTVYSGKCRIQQVPDQASTGDEPGQAYQLMSKRQLQLPVSTSGNVRADDRVEITACANDPSLVGKRFTVRDEAGKSEATARRLGIQIATS